jgi:uncharacterized membrane protein YedE/YeeE
VPRAIPEGGMQIDWVHFTPWTALGGGVLIGLAAAWLLLVDGRILGVSGIVFGVIAPKPGDWLWRVLFIGALIASPLVALAFGASAPRIDASLPTVVVGGLLVGIGTRLSRGCTSGHGVCGLARFSPRSLAATLTFMGGGFLTVFVVRHLLG